MRALEPLHGLYAAPRRVRVLSERLCGMIPAGAAILDVGSGDGRLGRSIAEARPDVSLQGLDVAVRPGAAIPVVAFDGHEIPFDSASFDLVLFVDVLHHTPDPRALLMEAKRVTRRWILVKDHLLEGLGAAPTLRFMDRLGNARYGVALPHTYWPRELWLRTYEDLGLRIEAMETRLGLYAWPLSLLFDRSLHFLALLGLPGRELRADTGGGPGIGARPASPSGLPS